MASTLVGEGADETGEGPAPRGEGASGTRWSDLEVAAPIGHASWVS